MCPLYNWSCFVLQSLTAYSQAIRLEPDARTYYNRHKVFLRLSRLNDAISDLSNAIKQDDKFVMVRHPSPFCVTT